jgi:chromosomal replication initiator protein
MKSELDHIEDRLHAELQRAVGASGYRIWLAPVKVRSVDEATITLSVHRSLSPWLRERYAEVLRRASAHAVGRPVGVRIEPSSVSQPAPPQVTGSAPRDLRPNPSLSFQRFIIGECNRFAHGAALAVAESPGTAFNPLFICGPPGVGKTHLLHAVAALVLAHHPGAVVRLTASEPFTNDFICALRENRLDRFKARFRHTDVLLVDDVQFLERKTRTEEEFFHTFNALFDVGAQIVLTSDKPPRHLDRLEARLRQRFEAGLVADIAPPDPETRRAIVEARVRSHALAPVDPAALDLLVARVTSSVRTLEGALIRVAAYASLTKRPVTPELTQQVLDSICPESDPPAQARPHVPVGAIQAAVCEQFGLQPQELCSPSRTRHLVWPRQLAMYLARQLTEESLPTIGLHFGGRDHSTVLYGCRQATARIKRDRDASRMVEKLTATLLTRYESSRRDGHL